MAQQQIPIIFEEALNVRAPARHRAAALRRAARGSSLARRTWH